MLTSEENYGGGECGDNKRAHMAENHDQGLAKKRGERKERQRCAVREITNWRKTGIISIRGKRRREDGQLINVEQREKSNARARGKRKADETDRREQRVD